MSRRKRGRQNGRGGGAALAGVLIFAALATLPLTFNALDLHILPVAAKSSYGVEMLPAPSNPAPVSLPAVARPVDPQQAPAGLPTMDAAREAAAVSGEDNRIRAMLHHAVRLFQPVVIPVRGSLPTLVLPAGPHAYTAADLVSYGALVMLPGNAGLLIDNVFVSGNARLALGAPDLRVLYLDNNSGGFASIVAWHGSLSFAGTAAQPLTITGWDRVAKAAASDNGGGRSYIREVAGQMTLQHVRVSNLGFWSGRTGGVAWTGVNGTASTGSASDSTFTDDTYGAFISRSQNVSLTSDLFEFNQLDGVHVHRYSLGTVVTRSSSSRNGGNGFLVDRATDGTTLTGDVSEHNALNGYIIDGRPLVNGASASGSSVAPGSGTIVQGGAALDNGRTGILIEGGVQTIVRSDQVCAKITAIAVRYGATNTVLTGNDIRCDPRSGLSLGPVAPGTIASGNTIVHPRIGILIRNSGAVRTDNNVIIGATVFGISARGSVSEVRGVGNVISGTGFRAVDSRADANSPAMYQTNTAGWAHHVNVTFWSYLRFHPLAALWLSITTLVLLAFLWTRRRRLPAHPYPDSTHWQAHQDVPAVAAAPAATGGAGPQWLQPDPANFRGTPVLVAVAAPPPPAADEFGSRAAAHASQPRQPVTRTIPPWERGIYNSGGTRPANHRAAHSAEENLTVTRPLPKVTD